MNNVTENHVTEITTETICFDGIGTCEICGREIAYPKRRDATPTVCKSCMRDYEGDLLDADDYIRAGDGFAESH